MSGDYPIDMLKNYMSLRQLAQLANLMIDLDDHDDQERIRIAKAMWTTMPDDLKVYARKPVRLFGRRLFRHRYPDPGHLAFLLGHYWEGEERGWVWDGELKDDTFRTLVGGKARYAVLIMTLLKDGTLSLK